MSAFMPRRARAARRLSTAVLSGLVGALLAAAPAQAQPDPGNDLPTLPADCNNHTNNVQPPGACHINDWDPSRPTIVLWGDSHAWEWVPALQGAVGSRSINLVGFWWGSCPPFRSTIRTQADFDRATECQQTNYLATRFVSRLDRQHKRFRVVLGAYWQQYRAIIEGLRYHKFGNNPDYAIKMAGLFEQHGPALFGLLGRRGIRTDVIGQSPVVPPDPCARDHFACWYKRSRALLQESGVESWVRELMTPLPSGKRLIDVADQVCLERTCPGYRDGVYTFLDKAHITATRSRMSRSAFAPTVRRVA